MAEHNDFGKLAEDEAVLFLKNEGYEILERNFRWQKAEIDIIAEFKGKIIIAEVKARANSIFMEPQEAVNKRKIRNLILAADFYLSSKGIDQEIRFDIISVLRTASGHLQISHLPNAFEAFDGN